MKPMTLSEVAKFTGIYHVDIELKPPKNFPKPVLCNCGHAKLWMPDDLKGWALGEMERLKPTSHKYKKNAEDA